ncbi:MAG: MMPL family transporter [Acidimicrobiia bacterium]
MLGSLGRWCHNRRGIVVIAWLVLFLGMGAASSAAGPGFETTFTPPDVESARGFELLDEHFSGTGSGFGGTIVVRADQGIDDPAVRGAIDAFLAKVDALDELTVQSPFANTPQAQGQIAREGPLAGKVAFARVEVAGEPSIEDMAAISEDVFAMEPDLDGLQVEYGGQLFAEFVTPESEVLGLGFAIVILIASFGSVLAMGLPIGTAAAGIGIGVSLVTIISNFMAMPDFTTVLAIMIGLGVGIDYALFIVTRYREGMHAGLDSEESAAVAINTAGRAVLFAGITVVISLLGMVVNGLAFVNGLAVGAATVVLLTMLASVTLLPALLGFAGDRVELTRWRGLIAAGLVAAGLIAAGLGFDRGYAAIPIAAMVLVVGLFLPALKREAPHRRPRPVEETLPYRWSRVIQKYPWPAVVLGFVALIALALPVFGLRLGFSDEGNLPESTTTRRAYDLLSEAFGPGHNGPLIVVAEVPENVDFAALVAVTGALQQTEGVASAFGPVPSDFANPPASKAVLWQVVPEAGPQEEATEELLHRLRNDVLPQATSGARLQPFVAGFVAVSADFSQYLGERLPLFIGIVLLLSFMLLLVVFRSLLVPLKAVVMNLVSIGAAYGAVVMVFQWGWGKELVGIGKGGPIEPFIPMMMFAIVFGLSMDYEVFLLSRVKEEYDRGSSNAKAVADGLAATARVITAAAAIMVVVFGSFLLEDDRIIKIFGTGLATAVLLDATVVRMLLVPATMELLGDRNWWLPGWLGRFLPKIDVEGTRPVALDT